MLLGMGVPAKSACALLNGTWLDAKRWRLHRIGGRRLEAFETEMQAFREAYKNPSARYRLFKYVVVGAATLLLPARRFYGMREWYAERQLGRYRERLVRDGVTASYLSQNSPEE